MASPTPAAAAAASAAIGAATAPVGILRKSSGHGTSSDAGAGESGGGTDLPGNNSQTAHEVQIVTDKPAAPVETTPPQPEALCDGAAEEELAALMPSASRSARRSAAAETSLIPSRRGFPPTLLRRLFLTECNSYCVDCGRREDGIPDKLTTFAAAAPSSANSEDMQMRLAWADVNYGTLLCGRCALQHLAVEGGDEVQKSTVVNLISGQWTLPYVMAMLEGGNNSFLIFLKHSGSSLSAKDLRYRYSSSNKTAKMYRSMLSEKTMWALRARGYHTSTPRSSRRSGDGYKAVHSEEPSPSRSHHATERRKPSSAVPKTSKSSTSSSNKARSRSQSVEHKDAGGLSSSKHGKHTRRHTSAEPLALERDRDDMLAAAKVEHHRSKHATVAASNIEAMNYDYEEAHRRHLSLKASTSGSNKKKHSRHGHRSSQPRVSSGAPTRHADGRLIGSPSANIPVGVSIPHSSGGSQGSAGRRREREVMTSSLRESLHHSHSPPPSMLRTSTYRQSLSSPDAPEGGIFLGHASVGNFGEASLANLDYHPQEKSRRSSGSKLRNSHKSMSSMQYLA